MVRFLKTASPVRLEHILLCVDDDMRMGSAPDQLCKSIVTAQGKMDLNRANRATKAGCSHG
ncbi:MAG: hypothetical protein ACLVKF_18645 [Neglectibacter timonensis]